MQVLLNLIVICDSFLTALSIAVMDRGELQHNPCLVHIQFTPIVRIVTEQNFLLSDFCFLIV